MARFDANLLHKSDESLVIGSADRQVSEHHTFLDGAHERTIGAKSDAPSASASPSTGNPSERARRRARRKVHRAQILEPRSLTDARARIDDTSVVLPRKGHVRKVVLGTPLATMLSDVGALVAVALIVSTSIGDAFLFGLTVLAARAATRQYRLRLSLSVLDDLPRTIVATLCGVGLTLAISYVLEGGRLHSHDLLVRAAWFMPLGAVLQSLTFAAARHVRRRRPSGQRTLIVGTGQVATTLAAALTEHPSLGLNPVAFVDLDGVVLTEAAALPVIASEVLNLPRIIVEKAIGTMVLALDGTGEKHVDTIITAHQTGCNILLVPSMFELHHDSADVERVCGIPLLRLRPDPTLRPTWWVKRAVDVTIGAMGLIVLALPLVAVAVASLIDSGRPVLFWQERIGLDGRPFRICKFSSMRPLSEMESQTTWNIADDPRVSRFGKMLRRTSIDEVPQLWNVFRGQMSLVGPRPERATFVQTFSTEHERYWARHRVPVGLTGLAQVNGLRGDTSIRERARYDNYYIANWSLWLDLKIVLLTVREVLGARGR